MKNFTSMALRCHGSVTGNHDRAPEPPTGRILKSDTRAIDIYCRF